jgi:hypothetical protein
MKFTIDDIKDRERLNKMVEKETMQIYMSPAARKGRSLDTIKYAVQQGKVAELYLIENYGYHESDIRWHDLKDEEGNYTEVKAYNVWSKDAPFVQKDIKRYKTEKWSKSKWYILFKYEYGSYELLDKIQLR